MFYYDADGFLHVYDTRDLHACHKSVAGAHGDYVLAFVERIHKIFRAEALTKAKANNRLPAAATAATPVCSG